ncbi:MAG: asparagine synthase-related protein [Candidatus Bathyarchaeia archaeon]
MGAMLGIVDKKGRDVSDTAFMMLDLMSHRGSEAFGVASPRRTVKRTALERLQKENMASHSVIGYNFAKISSRDRAQPIQSLDFSVVFDGRLFPPREKCEAEFFLENLLKPRGNVTNFIRRFNGDYVFAIVGKSGIVAGRDLVGARPLYFGESKDFCVIASERKALWAIGLETVDSFPPGKLAVINKRGFSFKTAKSISQPSLQMIGMDAAVRKLGHCLLRSTRRRVSDIEEVAVAFSGGVDSSLVAFLTKLCNVDARLVCIGLEDQEEKIFAERAAKALELPLHTVTYSLDDVEEGLPRILWLIEEPNPVNVSIAMPIFWAAEQSAKLGFHVLMTGQGGDELFGGYYRYLEEYAKHGLAGLQERIYHDVVSSYESNFERDNKVCAFHKVELRMPFVDREMVKLALSISPDLKIASPGDMLRKRVLRQTARKLGIPKFIAEKPKKAIQYTTGVNQALRKLAKKEGLTLRKYVKKIFSKTYKNAGIKHG